PARRGRRPPRRRRPEPGGSPPTSVNPPPPLGGGWGGGRPPADPRTPPTPPACAALRRATLPTRGVKDRVCRSRGVLNAYSRCQTALRNAAPRVAAPQVLVSALSAVGSQGDAANAMNCGSISGCVGTIWARFQLPSGSCTNSSGSQNGQFGQLMVARCR